MAGKIKGPETWLQAFTIENVDLAPGRENSLQGDNERKAKEGRHVIVRQVAPGYCGAERVHLHIGLWR